MSPYNLVLVLSLIIVVNAAPGARLNSGELMVLYDNTDVFTAYRCQSCFEYRWTQHFDESHYFRHGIFTVAELASDGSQCCRNPRCDSICNDGRVISTIPPTLTVESVEPLGQKFTGVLSSGGTSSCTPPGSGGNFCADFEITDRLYIEETNVSLSRNLTFITKPHTLHSRIKISNWGFKSDSTGFRIILVLQSVRNYVRAWRLHPSLSNAMGEQVFKDFEAITIENFDSIGRVEFSPVARVDGSDEGTPITVTGPHIIRADPNGRFIYIDLPTFQSIEYDTFIRVDYEDNASVHSVTISAILIFISILSSIMV